MPSNPVLKPDSPESSVINANVQFYRQIAAKYDLYETCASNPELQKMLARDVDHIDMVLGARSKPVECLDCGGGTGNLASKMLQKGWSVTVVDVSSEMLAILSDKARRAGYSPHLVHDSFSDFLLRCGKSYDVITFSSVLHHLYSYLPGVALAADHIEKKGIFYSVFDPVISPDPRRTRYFEALDTFLAKLAYDRRDLFPGIGRRLKKAFRTPDGAQHPRNTASIGDLAEYHAKTGVDDRAIVELLSSRGFTIVDHLRWASGRTPPARFVNRRLHLMETFKIMAQHAT